MLQCFAYTLLLKKSSGITVIEPALLWRNATLLHKFQLMKLQLQIFTATSEIRKLFHCFYSDFCMDSKIDIVLIYIPLSHFICFRPVGIIANYS